MDDFFLIDRAKVVKMLLERSLFYLNYSPVKVLLIRRAEKSTTR